MKHSSRTLFDAPPVSLCCTSSYTPVTDTDVIDPQILHDEILNILIAGRDTTAGTLTFAVYFLCMYPHVMERLRKEILDAVGPSRRPDYDDIKDMKYLRAFLNGTSIGLCGFVTVN